MNEPTIRDKNYSFAKKCEYFWMYYKWHAIGGAVLLLIVCSVIVSIATAKEKALSIMIFDTTVVDDTSLIEDYEEFARIDTKKYEVVCQMGGSTEDDQSYTSAMYNAKLMALVNAGDLDILVTELKSFNQEADAGFFMDLRQIFSDEELSNMPDKVVAADGRVLGIRAEKLPAFFNREMFDGTKGASQVAVGIIVNSKNLDNAKRFVEFLNQ